MSVDPNACFVCKQPRHDGCCNLDKDAILRRLGDVATRIDEINAPAVRKRRDAAIGEALKFGATPQEVADAAELTRGRISQIVNSGRTAEIPAAPSSSSSSATR